MLKPFLIGATGYPLLELLYRGRTHYSMAVAGGVSVCLIHLVNRLSFPLPLKAALCGGGITAVELLCGMIWNRSYTVWDYRRIPLNFQGQICLPYTLLWCLLSAGVLSLNMQLQKRLARM